MPSSEHPADQGDPDKLPSDANPSWRKDPMPGEDADGTDGTKERRHPMPSRRFDIPRQDTPNPNNPPGGRPLHYESMHRPDGTYWNEPFASWPGPSWMADRFPLSPKERLAAWGPKAWDEFTREQSLIAWGYEHEPGVLEPAVIAALEAAGMPYHDYCSKPPKDGDSP
jgi:hypothetical protein